MKYLTNSKLGGSGIATLAAKVAKILAIATQNDNHSQHQIDRTPWPTERRCLAQIAA
jgi:hypothetical protein